MQNDELKNWYKSSFEKIQGKPVPDVWDAVESALPSRKVILFKRSLYFLVPVLLVGAWLGITNLGSADYYPRTEFYSNGFIVDLSDNSMPSFISNNVAANTAAPVSINPAINNLKTSGSLNKQVTTNGPIAQNQYLSVTSEPTANLIPDFNLPEKLERLDNLNSKLINTEVKREVIGHTEVQQNLPTFSKPNYVGFNVGLYNVTMLNNTFFKARDKGTLSSNSMFIKPSFSILYGTKIRNNTFLEVSATHANLGQAVSTYQEGTYSKQEESLSYLSIGVGVIKYMPVTEKYSTYYGLNVDGRFLMKQSGSLSEDFTSQDFAIGAKGGMKIQASEHFAIGAGIAINASVINSYKGTSKIPRSFNATRNAFMGLDLKATYAF